MLANFIDTRSAMKLLICSTKDASYFVWFSHFFTLTNLIGSPTRKKMKLPSYSTKVAFIGHKVASKKSSTKPIYMRSSFEELAARNPNVKTKLNFDASIKSYSFLNFLNTQINERADKIPFFGGWHQTRRLLLPSFEERSIPPAGARALASHVLF